MPPANAKKQNSFPVQAQTIPRPVNPAGGAPLPGGMYAAPTHKVNAVTTQNVRGRVYIRL